MTFTLKALLLISILFTASISNVFAANFTNCKVKYVIYDTDKKADFSKIVQDDNFSYRPCNLNIEALVACAREGQTVLDINPRFFTHNGGYVRITLRNNSTGVIVKQKTESTAPYYLWGNNGMNVSSAQLPDGTYTISSILVGRTPTPPYTFTLHPCVPF